MIGDLLQMSRRIEELEEENARLRAALDEAISLANVPEHAQDDEWYVRLAECQKALESK